MTIRRWGSLLSLAGLALAVAVACGASSNGPGFGGQGKDGGGAREDDGSGGGPSLVDDSGSVDPSASLVIDPPNQSVDVVTGQPLPTAQFRALLSGAVVAATWSIDRGEIGAVGETTGLFHPTGTLGGKAKITASYRGREASTAITVRVRVVQNGQTPAGDAGGGSPGGGSGGNGGVGGDGAGGAVDASKQATLRGITTPQSGLAFLYPYDGTVWPRGILAPLLQWSSGGRRFDAVYIKISEASFSYEGYFGKPAAVPPSEPFQRHPIPQDVWRKLAYSNGGEDVNVTVVLSEGNTAYGPMTQKWKIAAGTLKGTVYYNSYGTALAKNYTGGMGGFARFGGATLAIRGSSTDPALVAGSDGGEAQCRVCHSVAAKGSVLITQKGGNGYNSSSAYSLAAPIQETSMSPEDGRFAWPALSPDGTFLFSNADSAGAPASALYTVPGGTPIASAGLPPGLKAGRPAFSPDAKHLAFTLMGGPSADGRSLALLDFDPATKTFANAQSVHTPAGTSVAVWPSFLPTNDSVVFQVEMRTRRPFGETRSDCESGGECSNTGVRAEIWWLHGPSKSAHRLDNLNGVGHVPTGDHEHNADATLNYEPTVSPVPSGGYAWVVFTSRRLYGNVATINPFWSDPRFHDISQSPTTKKLWVAAVDLNASPGTDPSHPAFYLPAQELFAGNARGYWVVDPCRAAGASCETGDECCGGFCRSGSDGGALVCTDQKPACAREFEKCTTDSDCCADIPGVRCLNDRCNTPVPR